MARRYTWITSSGKMLMSRPAIPVLRVRRIKRGTSAATWTIVEAQARTADGRALLTGVEQPS